MKVDLPKPQGSKCLVCEHPDGGSAHFASTSCLACAAFFRRTVSLNINFQCKKDRRCTIYHELRMICRACRFDKCLAAGMKRECVQKRRSNKKKLIKKEKPWSGDEDINEQQVDAQIGSPFSVEKKSPFTPATRDSPRIEAATTCAHEPSTSTSVSGPDSVSRPEDRLTPCEIRHKIIGLTGPELLRHYVDEFKRSMDRRRMMFTDSALVCVMEDCGQMPFSIETPPPHTLARQYECLRVDNLLSFEFCKSVPGFDLMDGPERALFYRMCTLSFGMLDIAWITVQAYHVADEKPLIMYTDGSVCTVKDLSYGWDHEGPNLQQDDKKSLFYEIIVRLHESLCQPFRSMKIDLVEYAALKAFCIWKLGYCEYTPRMKVMAKEHETALLIGLNAYYEDLFDNRMIAAQRLGNLILMMGTVFEMNQMVLETYKSAELFHLFKMDNISKILLSI